MHKLLARQLRRILGDGPPPDDLRWASLVSAVCEAYRQADDDRLLLERSLELTAQELIEKNRTLKDELEQLGRTQARLGRSEASFRFMIERLPDPVLVHEQGVIVYVNPLACSFLGRPTDALVGSSIFDLLHPDDRMALMERARAAAQNGQTHYEECRFVHLDGRVFIAECSGIPVEFETRAARMVVARDVTERREMQQRLMVSDRMASLGTLCAGMAHEINNPLTYVMTNLEYVRTERESAPGPALDEALQDALEGAGRVRNIVRDLKTFSRPDEEGDSTAELPEVLRTALNMAQHEIKHRAQLETHIATLPRVSGSASRLGQVFLNLLVNAAHAIPPGRARENQISVRAFVSGDGAVVEIQDSGSGMSEEVLQKIFVPFFTTKAVGVGTGLSLAICHGIVRSIGGEIEVESALGQGSTFRVRLPIARQGATRADGTEKSASLPRRRVLVIDDEPQLARALMRQLGRFHSVEASLHPREALALLERERFDVIVCDLMMPEMTGMELHAELERTNPDAARRTVFLTGGAATTELRAFINAREGRYLDKPAELLSLRRMIEEVASDGAA